MSNIYQHCGHGHVYPNPGGIVVRCGGPALCSKCEADLSHKVDEACQIMHDAYESAATLSGWRTQEASRKPWADVPESNKAAMRAAVRALFDWQRLLAEARS